MIGGLLIIVAILVGTIVALLIQRARWSRAERALRESEERFRLLADRAPVIVWTARPDTTLDYVNTTCVEFTGRPAEQLLNEGWLDIVHPEDLDRCLRTYVPAFEARKPFLFEYRVRCANGDYRWLLASGVPKYGPDGGFTGYIGCDIDITKRKNAEERIRESQAALEASQHEIQHLAGRLIEAQDAERARIARDLHDDVSQQLAGMSIAFSGLKQRLNQSQVSEDLQEELRTLHQRTSTLAQNVRHLSHDLHPTVLRHAGLVAALTSYCADLERTHSPRLICSAEGDFGSMSAEAALCLYRVAQEALRNVIAHAGASRAHVRLLRRGDIAEMTVTDDGKGFDFASSIERGKGLGLVSITERVRLAGGTVRIVSDSKKGTRVCVQVPANSPPKTGAGPGADRTPEHTLAGTTQRDS